MATGSSYHFGKRRWESTQPLRFVARTRLIDVSFNHNYHFLLQFQNAYADQPTQDSLLLRRLRPLPTLTPLLRPLLRSLIRVIFHLLLALLLPLPLELPNLLRRTILNQITLVINPGPLRQAVGDIHNALAVEHVAARFEVRLVLVGLEVDQGGEEEDHVAPFVHDGAVAEGAAHFAGQLVLD
jgi:hypothetical protein